MSDALTHEQVIEAIAQMGTSCDLAYADGYRAVSARSVLLDLGYERHIDQVLGAIAGGGFDYCLDRTIPCSTMGQDTKSCPSQDVCWWGPDQLKSRLECLRGDLSDGIRKARWSR